MDTDVTVWENMVKWWLLGFSFFFVIYTPFCGVRIISRWLRDKSPDL